MNRKQKAAVALGAIVVAGLGLFPPFFAWGNVRETTEPMIFDWVLNKPEAGPSVSYQVDVPRLVALVAAVVGLVTAGVILLANPRRQPVADSFGNGRWDGGRQ